MKDSSVRQLDCQLGSECELHPTYQMGIQQ